MESPSHVTPEIHIRQSTSEISTPPATNTCEGATIMRHSPTRLSQGYINALKPPVTGRDEFPDTECRGLELRITSNDHRSWSLTYRFHGQQRRLTLGSWPDTDVKTARQQADAAKADRRNGIDPHAEKVRERRDAQAAATAARMRRADAATDAPEGTFKAIGDEYLRYLEQKKARNTAREVRRYFERDLYPLWGSRRMAEITDDDVIEVVMRVSRRGSPIAANRLLGWCKSLWTWAIKQALLRDQDDKRIKVSVLAGIEMRNEEGASDRVLTEGEIVNLWRACDAIDPVWAALYRILLLTGQRLREVAQMEWSEISDLNGAAPTWTLPASRSKNGMAHVVALSQPAAAILRTLPQGRWVFRTTGGNGPLTTFSRSKLQIDAEIAKLRGGKPFDEPWTNHDLRRTCASQMIALHIGAEVVDRGVLNHRHLVKGVAGIYNRYEYADEAKAAWITWGRKVMSLIDPNKATKVHPLRA
jgi:integrase